MGTSFFCSASGWTGEPDPLGGMYVPLVETTPDGGPETTFSLGALVFLYEGEIGIGLLWRRNCLAGEETGFGRLASDGGFFFFLTVLRRANASCNSVAVRNEKEKEKECIRTFESL